MTTISSGMLEKETHNDMLWEQKQSWKVQNFNLRGANREQMNREGCQHTPTWNETATRECPEEVPKNSSRVVYFSLAHAILYAGLLTVVDYFCW